ncbi:anthranilate synthase component I family protein [Ferruginibacter sp. HRS2-29]|nr:anthranilate synthase component I family protein [Ferruginibacter sp. HRS2-29]MCP9752125.1 anthranilate synthase component I family protein [Ferruginibacter sp. HRS2-29]
MLNWASRFNIFCFLDNNEYSEGTVSFECILAAGCRRSVKLMPGTAYQQLRTFYDERPAWLFGHLGYDLKNETEKLSSSREDKTGFGPGFFFEPEYIIRLRDNEWSVESDHADPASIIAEIEMESAEAGAKMPYHIPLIQHSTTKPEYLRIINALKEHIVRGDCYEINFCQHFFAEDAVVDPIQLYHKLIHSSPVPFAALYKWEDKYCLCASPERYLRKEGQSVISQPIKGTSRRFLQDAAADENSKESLRNSAKDKSENVMVVDLVRNDLSRICREGSVHVKELFGIYSFPQVHQMISTVKGLLKDGLHWTDAIRATFPMGSMTGAPKKRVMELIEQYEATNRGLFSGSIGYVTPDGDFDFNVVIRSIFYNASQQYLSFFAGGGITFYSNAEDEYEESLLKTKAIVESLGRRLEIRD